MKTRTTTRRLVAGTILGLLAIAAGCDESRYAMRTHSGLSPYARTTYESTTYHTSGPGSVVEVYSGYPPTTTYYRTAPVYKDQAAVIWYPNTTSRVHYNSRNCAQCGQTYPAGQNHQCQNRGHTTQLPICIYCGQRHADNGRACIRDGHGKVVVIPANTQRTLTRGELAEQRRREVEVERYKKQVEERNEWARKQNARNAARR